MTLQVASSSKEVFSQNRIIRDAGIQKIDQIRKAFSSMQKDFWWDTSRVGIFTTWSDGRAENKPFASTDSNLELRFLQISGSKTSQGWAEDISNQVRTRLMCIVDNIEVQALTENNPILYRDAPWLVFPTRTWDAVKLNGDPDIERVVQRVVSEEIIKNPVFARKFYERLKSHKSILQNWQQHFHGSTDKLIDQDNAIIYYDPKKHIQGVKTWPLRVIQYTLALALMRHIRDSKIHPPFMSELPTNIVDRLEYIWDNNLTTMNYEEIMNMRYIYAFFLNLYHEMQYRNMTTGQTAFWIDETLMDDIWEMLDTLHKTMLPDKFFKS